MKNRQVISRKHDGLKRTVAKLMHRNAVLATALTTIRDCERVPIKEDPVKYLQDIAARALERTDE